MARGKSAESIRVVLLRFREWLRLSEVLLVGAPELIGVFASDYAGRT